ncbi:MAG: nucleotidyltransferase domain-containing protein [Anaerolineae bacterium]|jgi:predicted nucleotidyltransferase
MKELTRYLVGTREVLLAYLFGSQADGTAGPQSDCDIALLGRF